MVFVEFKDNVFEKTCDVLVVCDVLKSACDHLGVGLVEDPVQSLGVVGCQGLAQNGGKRAAVGCEMLFGAD
jgi:hypothetical protein